MHPLILHRVAAHGELQLPPYYLWGSKHNIAHGAHVVPHKAANQIRLQA